MDTQQPLLINSVQSMNQIAQSMKIKSVAHLVILVVASVRSLHENFADVHIVDCEQGNRPGQLVRCLSRAAVMGCNEK
jgi:hypothetical protein